jgi:hypothetical protein
LKPDKSFSIIFRGARTLDLMMPYGDRNVVLDALDLVLGAYQEAKVKVAKDVLLLRYVWLDVDKVCWCGDIASSCHISLTKTKLSHTTI